MVELGYHVSCHKGDMSPSHPCHWPLWPLNPVKLLPQQTQISMLYHFWGHPMAMVPPHILMTHIQM